MIQLARYSPLAEVSVSGALDTIIDISSISQSEPRQATFFLSNLVDTVLCAIASIDFHPLSLLSTEYKDEFRAYVKDLVACVGGIYEVEIRSFHKFMV